MNIFLRNRCRERCIGEKKSDEKTKRIQRINKNDLPVQDAGCIFCLVITVNGSLADAFKTLKTCNFKFQAILEQPV